MIRLASIAFVWLAGVASVASPAWATTVQVVKGVVSVRQADGFRQVNGSVEVYNGNQVMAAPGGMARIVYPDGCVVQVGPGGVATVGECKQPMTAGLEEAPAPVARTPWWLIGGVGAGVALGICAATNGCFDEDEKPRGRSP
jgi:hypothetical protein